MKENDKKNIIIFLATLVTSILSLGIFNYIICNSPFFMKIL